MSIELSQEKSEQQSAVIGIIAIQVWMLDVDYCKELVKQMFSSAHRQESLAVLNPSYPQSKNDLIRLQATALSHLVNYVTTLKEVDKCKRQVEKETVQLTDIQKLFI